MQFNIIGVSAKDGTYVFNLKADYVPRQNEELEINGCIYVVKYVRYNLSCGSVTMQNVQLGLARTMYFMK